MFELPSYYTMAAAPEIGISSNNGYNKRTHDDVLFSPGASSLEPREPTARLLSVSSGSSEPSLTSDEFYRMHSKEGLAFDLGSEIGNVADIFGHTADDMESLDYNGVTFDESNEGEIRYMRTYVHVHI